MAVLFVGTPFVVTTVLLTLLALVVFVLVGWIGGHTSD